MFGVNRNEFLSAFVRDDNGVQRSGRIVFDVIGNYFPGRSQRGCPGRFQPGQLLADIVLGNNLVCVPKIEEESWHRDLSS